MNNPISQFAAKVEELAKGLPLEQRLIYAALLEGRDRPEAGADCA
jgi:hypothetical protein